MTTFILIEPAMKLVRTVDRDSLDAACRAVGLPPGETDHGMITKHLGIVVYEYGLFAPPEGQFYTVIAGRLYAGNAVVYQVDEFGVTIDAMDAHAFSTACTFLQSRELVERAIRAGRVLRPQMTIGERVIWQWPAPRPEGFGP